MNDMKCMSCGCEITEPQTVLSACGARLHIYEIDNKAELCESCHDELSVCDWCGIAVDENAAMIDVHDGSRICPFCAKGEDRSGRIFGSEITPESFCPKCKSRFYTPAKVVTPCCGVEYELSKEDYEICSTLISSLFTPRLTAYGVGSITLEFHRRILEESRQKTLLLPTIQWTVQGPQW